MSNATIAEEIKKAMGAHGAWKLRIRTAISTGNSDASPASAKNDVGCAFGKWLSGPSIDAVTRQGMAYKVVRRLHAEFHECAGRVLALALDAKKREALDLLEGEYSLRSEKLLRALTKWRGEVMQAGAGR